MLGWYLKRNFTVGLVPATGSGQGSNWVPSGPNAFDWKPWDQSVGVFPPNINENDLTQILCLVVSFKAPALVKLAIAVKLCLGSELTPCRTRSPTNSPMFFKCQRTMHTVVRHWEPKRVPLVSLSYHLPSTYTVPLNLLEFGFLTTVLTRLLTAFKGLVITTISKPA